MFKIPIKMKNKTVQITEAKLLKAISHEVRTPLATIKNANKFYFKKI